MPGVFDVEGRPRRSLPASTLERLQELPSPREADAHAFAIMLSLVNAGYPEHEAYGLLVDPGHPGGYAVQRRHRKGPGKARLWVQVQWHRAQVKVQASPAVGDEREMRAALARIEHAVADRTDLWGGQAGATRRRVIEAVLYFAVLAKNSNVRVSDRQIAEHLQMRQATVNTALRWHREQGIFLKRLQVGEGLRGTTYSVFYRGSVQGRISSSPSAQVRGTDTPLAATKDAFSHSGLGPNAGILLQTMPELPCRAKSSGSSSSPKGDGVRTLGSREAKEDVPHDNAKGHIPGLCSGRGKECRCRHVVRLLELEHGPTVRELAESTGLSQNTVRRHLQRSARLGLVAADEDGHLFKLAFDDVALAVAMNVQGNGARRADGFALQREGWQRREAAKRGYEIVRDELGVHFVVAGTGEVVMSQRPREEHGDAARLA